MSVVGEKRSKFLVVYGGEGTSGIGRREFYATNTKDVLKRFPELGLGPIREVYKLVAEAKQVVTTKINIVSSR